MNGDGLLSKSEMARFVKLFTLEEDTLVDTVNKIFDEYDVDMNGFLDKIETLRLVNTILKNQGKPATTIPAFNRFFSDYDINNDGVLSKKEITRFVKDFLKSNRKDIPDLTIKH